MKAFFRKHYYIGQNTLLTRTNSTKKHGTRPFMAKTNLVLTALSVSLLISCVNTVETNDKNGIGSYKFPEATAVSGKYTSQVYTPEGTSCLQLETTFLKNWEDIPFLSMEEFCKFLSIANDRGWKLEKNNSVYTYKYNPENATPEALPWPDEWNKDELCFDFENQRIYSNNFTRIITSPISLNNGFGVSPIIYLDTADKNHPKIQGSSLSTQIQPSESFSININDYDLKMFVIDDTVYLPFQALVPLFIPIATFSYSSGDYFFQPQAAGENTATLKAYILSSSNKKSRSKLKAEYNYRTLCMLLDTTYGLKNQRTQFGKSDITYFNDEFFKAGLGFDILSTDTAAYETALIKFLKQRIDDGHTDYINPSFYQPVSNYYDLLYFSHTTRGDRIYNLDLVYYNLQKLREEAKGKPGLYYVQEKGADKLAVLSYDGFYSGEAGKTSDLSELAELNTYAFLRAAFDDIATQEHSSVKNIVFDVSHNSGGSILSLILNLLFLNDTSSVYLPIKNHLDNSITKFYYTVEDENGNEPVKSGYNFYVLTSEASFSCGNAFPAQCKYQNLAKIIGKQSGGGAAVVKNTQTADGALFHTSSALELCAVDSEGNYICIDGGVPVDLEISYENFYSGETTYQNLYEILKKEYSENF